MLSRLAIGCKICAVMERSSIRLAILILAGLVAITVVVSVLLLSGESEDVTDPSKLDSNDVNRVGPLTPVLISDSSADSSSSEDTESRRKAIKSNNIFISGRVLDEATGLPVTAYEFQMIQIEPQDEPNDRWRMKPGTVQETVRDDEGLFFFSLKNGGEYGLILSSSSYARRDDIRFTVPSQGGLTGLCFELDRGVSISGRVVEDATDKPISGAWIGRRGFMDRYVCGRTEEWYHTKTGDDGKFILSGLTLRENRSSSQSGSRPDWDLMVTHPAFAAERIQVFYEESDKLEIRLSSGYSVFGQASDGGRPISGLFVYLIQRDERRLSVCTLTGPDGSYRLNPVSPSKALVGASAPLYGLGKDLDFITEGFNIELFDRDVEVNFGPNPDHVVWRGVLFILDGQPLSNGHLNVRGRDKIKGIGAVPYSRRVNCDENGAFEVKKLFPEKYSLYVQVPRQKSFFVEEVEFTEPGLVERDVHIKGGILEGKVLFATTGKPPPSEALCYVEVLPCFPNEYGYQTESLEDGRFRLIGVQAGRYSISAGGLGFPPVLRHGFELADKQVLDDICILIPAYGKLKVQLTGFDKTELRRMVTNVHKKRQEESEEAWVIRDNQLPGNLIGTGLWKAEKNLGVGEWIAKFRIENHGTVSKEFEIFSDRTTELLLTKKDFPHYEGIITVTGKVAYSNGSQIVDAELLCRADDNVAGLEGRARWITGRTDENGAFVIGGFKPGRWTVRIKRIDGGQLSAPDIIIPADPEIPYRHDFAILVGEVTFGLFNRATNLIPGEDDAPLMFAILKTGSDEVQALLYDAPFQESNTIAGLEPGDYYLKSFSTGYEDYQSDPFTLKEGQTINLGTIVLEPKGMLTLEVVDENGNPIQHALASFPGISSLSSKSFELAPGQFRYFGLPKGQASVTVKAFGFKPKKFSHFIQPAGVYDSVRVVLEKE